jgi:single-strand DNA-binding protein
MYQELTILGIMGKDPDVRYTTDGKQSATLSVATSRNTAKGEKETTWFRVTCWEKTAEYMGNYAQKGTKVLVRGRLVVDPQTGGPRVFTRQDGTASAAFEMVADTVKLISGYKDYNQTAQAQRQAAPVQRAPQAQQAQSAKQDSFADVDDIPW